VEWAFVLEGRTGPDGVLVILDERTEAESIAAEVRQKGHRVVVRTYDHGPPAPGAGAA
jgi:hypothetical protein